MLPNIIFLCVLIFNLFYFKSFACSIRKAKELKVKRKQLFSAFNLLVKFIIYNENGLYLTHLIRFIIIEFI